MPWELSLQIVRKLSGADVRVSFIKAGDHRLSTADDLKLLEQTVGALLGQDGG